MMEELYKQYGEYMIQMEILQAKMMKVKQQIVNEINKKEKEDGTKSS